jgi:hypothetical protein
VEEAQLIMSGTLTCQRNYMNTSIHSWHLNNWATNEIARQRKRKGRCSGRSICLVSFHCNLSSTVQSRNLMTLGSGIQVILRLLPQRFERLQCQFYWWERSLNCSVEMASGSVITYQVSWILVKVFNDLLGVLKGHTQQVDLVSASNFYEYGNRPKEIGTTHRCRPKMYI